MNWFESLWVASIRWLAHQLSDLQSISILLGVVAAFLGITDIFARQWNDPLTRFLRRLWKTIESSNWIRIPESLIKFYVSLSGGLYVALSRLVGTKKGVIVLILSAPILNRVVLQRLGHDVVWPILLACSAIPWILTFIVLHFSPFVRKIFDLNLVKERAYTDLAREDGRIYEFCKKVGLPPESVFSAKQDAILHFIDNIDSEMAAMESKAWRWKVANIIGYLRPIVILLCLYFLFFPVFNKFWTLDVREALLIMACLLPSVFLVVEVIAAVVGFSVLLRSSKTESLNKSLAKSLRSISWSANFSLGFTLSLFITFVALDVGSIIKPGAAVPLTTQFLIANFFCDGLTLWFTMLIMRWAVSSHPILKLPMAIAIDVAMAGVLAIASLYLGLHGGPYEITTREAVNLLTMNEFDFATADLGPLFWVMHTTFIPTVFYCLLILFGWIGKLILEIWIIFSRRAAEDRPLALTASLLFAIVAIIQGYNHYK